MQRLSYPTAVAIVCIALAGRVTAETKDDLPSYLTDVTAGAVSAGSFVGLAESAISQIQSSQDLVLALKPFSSGNAKSGFGIAITPARTTIAPMSGQDYFSSDLTRALGALTLSYAEASSTVALTSYRK